MTIQHTDIYHCLKCGRIVYETHGQAAPTCCSQPMVRAVADVMKEIPHNTQFRNVQTQNDDSGIDLTAHDFGGRLTDHALLAEAIEISSWSRTIEDIDVSRYEELTQRLQSLHAALLDRFEDGLQHGARLTDAQQRLLTAIDALATDLRRDVFATTSWDAICERLDSLVVQLRRIEEEDDSPVRGANANRLAGQENSSHSD